MSILINGMEMPTSCAKCLEIGWHYVFECVLDDVEHGERKADCPLIPVPPHGDLIDRGYAIASACSGRIRALPTTEDGEDWIRVEEVRESIKDAPTVVPAEEG